MQELYFLKKLHKTPISERPIVSGYNSVSENVSAYLDYILKPLMQTVPSYLKNTYELLDHLNSKTFPEDCLLCIVDAGSLYPSIPQLEGTEVCIRKLEKKQLPAIPQKPSKTPV